MKSNTPSITCLVLSLAVCAFGQAPATGGKSITFHQTAEAAIAVGKAEKKVTVLYFTADWCTWCRKMQATTFPDAAVTALAPRFAWAKIDTDEEPATAAAYGVRGLPHMVLLNAEGQVIASRGGYQTAAQFAKFLADSAEKSGAPGTLTPAQSVVADLTKALAATKSEDESNAAVKAAIVKLAEARGGDREELLDALLKTGGLAWTGLAAALNDDGLSLRAAAGDVLKLATKQPLPFDPFAEKDERARQAAAWKQWVASNKHKVPTPEAGKHETGKPGPAKEPAPAAPANAVDAKE
jgi:thioredoxin-like negative regulator of GroEL